MRVESSRSTVTESRDVMSTAADIEVKTEVWEPDIEVMSSQQAVEAFSAALFNENPIFDPTLIKVEPVEEHSLFSSFEAYDEDATSLLTPSDSSDQASLDVFMQTAEPLTFIDLSETHESSAEDDVVFVKSEREVPKQRRYNFGIHAAVLPDLAPPPSSQMTSASHDDTESRNVFTDLLKNP